MPAPSRCAGLPGSHHEPPHAVLEQLDVKVADQPSPQAGELHVGKHLRGDDGMEDLDGFDFNNHGAIDDQVDPVTDVEVDSLVTKGRAT